MWPHTLIALFVLTVLCNCTTNHTTEISKAHWLIGTWENKTEQGSIYEAWEKVSANEFSGMSYKINETDTIVFENIRLLQEQGNLYYIPSVKDQNEGLPVRFAAKTVTKAQLIFENHDHDFPQVISYTKVTPDSLVAEISGMKNGQQSTRYFPMKLIN